MIDKRAITESERLHKTHLKEKAVDHSAEIDALTEEIEALRQQRQKALTRGDAAEAEKLKVQADNKRHRIVSLGTMRGNGATTSLQALVNFNRPHKKPLFQRLERRNESLERDKVFETTAAEALMFGGHRLLVESNLPAVLAAQLQIAEVAEYLLNTDVAPLADFVKAVADLEKSTPTDFPTETLKLHSRAALELKQYKTEPKTINDIDYRVPILPSEIIRARIKSFEFYSKHRDAVAA